MAQHDYNIANQGFSSFRSDLNNALSAIQTTNSGTSRPTGAVAGQLWLDTTSATTPTLKYYDGADDISLATIDHVGNTVNWLDSTVSITGLTTTATGTVLTLSDSASTSTVNLIIDNQKEIRFRETTANGTNYVALKAPASLSADLTFTLPTADGTNGQVLSTNGSGVLSFISPSAGISFQSAIKTSGFTAVAGEGYFCNTTSSAFTVTLPASPSAGNQVAIVDYAGTFATNKITLGANSNKINGVVANKQLDTNREAVTLVYVDSTQGWVSSSASNYGTQSIDPLSYTVDFLVIAGGGGGGGGGGAGGSGGGGAGGYRNSYSTETSGGGGTSETELTFNTGTVYTITVGAGGAAGSNAVRGSVGVDSSVSGTGITTITSTGGGGGGTRVGNSDGIAGGAGGGAGNRLSSSGTGTAGSGTANQGFAGGANSANTGSNGGGAGGGGASAVGVTIGGTQSAGSNGGAGYSSSITGSAVSRAGGGGGGGESGAGGTGGTGGGGAGGGTSSANPAVAGTANTGGGGGGCANYSSAPSAAGGKGVVILRMPTASYSGTTTGSPTVSTSGADTILVYNDSGTYTG
jgi:hypothetical protein